MPVKGARRMPKGKPSDLNARAEALESKVEDLDWPDEIKQLLHKYAQGVIQLNGAFELLNKLRQAIEGGEVADSKYKETETKLLPYFEALQKANGVAVVQVQELLVTYQPEIPKSARTTVAVRDRALLEWLAQNVENAQQALDEIKAIEAGIVKNMPPSIERAKWTIEDLGKEADEKIAADKQKHEARRPLKESFVQQAAQWFVKATQWIKSKLGKRIRKTQELNVQGKRLLSQMKQESAVAEAKAYIRQAYNIRGL